MTSPSTKPVRRWKLLLKLMFCLFSPILVVLAFYWVEDWEGARILAATKAKWIAKGETFDRNAFIPPPIPDDRNLGAIPLFKQTPDPTTGKLVPIALLAALRKADFNTLPRSTASNKTYPETIRKGIATAYSKDFPLGRLQDPIAQLNSIFPAWEEIRAESNTRSDCRFDLEYNSKEPFGRSFQLTIIQIALTRYGVYHGILSLNNNDSEKALEDILVILKLALGSARDRLLIGELVNITIVKNCSSVVIFGESKHYWNDDELRTLEESFSDINQLENGKEYLCAEVAGELAEEDFLKADRSDKFLAPSSFSSNSSEIPHYLIKYWPNGWFDLNSAQYVEYVLESIRSIDSVKRRVDSSLVDRIRKEILSRQANWTSQLPWNALVLSEVNGVVYQINTFSKSQVLLDEAVISCALERYYLKHRSYPSTLELLVPAFAKSLPNDIIGGAPYKYVLKKDGSYLLYSIGWNEKDDGGNPSGDWVWLNS